VSQYDAPDWQRVVTTVTAAGVSTDAPDWQRVVVGPSGAPVGGGAAELYMPGALWGLAGQTVPWWLVNNSDDTLGSVSRIYLVPLSMPAKATVSNVWLYNATSFSPNITDANYVGIYQATSPGSTSTGYDLVASTAAGTCDTLFARTGYLTCPLTASAALDTTEGKWFAAYLYNSTHFSYGSLAAFIPQLSPPGAWGNTRTTGAGYGSLPSSLTAADIVANYSNQAWLAVS
jgi:hypothetical protein